MFSQSRATPRFKAATALCASLLMLIQSISGFALDLGGMNFSRTYSAAPHIVHFTPGPRFFRVSGGVAFTQTATGKDGWMVTSMQYDASAEDGQRLKAQLSRAGRSVLVNTRLYDWEIGPLVKFVTADPKNVGQSAVTLFGELKDTAAQERVLRDGHMIINFHPAFENTLLGLRLLQADLMLIDIRAAELFRENGEDILGAGEAKPDQNFVARNRERMRSIKAWLKVNNFEFQSYVAGDVGTPIQFYVESDELKFTGSPRWFIWKDSDSADEAQARQMQAQVLKARAKLPLDDAKIMVALDHAALFDVLTTLEAKGNDFSLPSVRAELVSSRGFVERAEAIIQDLSELYKSHPSGKPFLKSSGEYSPDAQGRIEAVFDLHTRLKALSAEDRHARAAQARNSINRSALRRAALDLPVDADTKASDAISQKIQEQGGLNPIVYRSLERSMHYAALLRHYRSRHPEGFKELVKATQSIDTSPIAPRGLKVLTPTLYPRGRDAR